jgi:replicative DNA helicase
MDLELGRSAAEMLRPDPARLLRSDPWTTGFKLLDAHLGGGLHRGELVLVGGAPGVGKTTLALQMATAVARAGGLATYLCYEHSEEELLTRLLLMEAGLAHPYEAPLPRRIDSSTESDAATDPRLAAAVAAVRGYGERLRLVRGSGVGDAPIDLHAVQDAERSVLFVDYLQKVPSRFPGAPEAERVTDIVERLKDHAMRWNVPVVALVAADRSGLEGGRLRMKDLRGSTALAYEADVALILNEKQLVVARHHLVYGNPDAARFAEYVVCTIEKNRSGKAHVDLELRKRFAHGCFEPEAAAVTEQLTDDRVYID